MRRSREELRQLTLDIARQIIIEDGPEALTARRLAKAAGYTPGTIYNLFESLPDVLWHVNRDNFERIAKLFEELPDVAPAERIQLLAASYLELIKTESLLFRALFEGPRRSEAFPEWYTAAITRLIDSLAAEISAHAPKIPPADAHDEASAMFVAMHGISELYVSGRLDLVSDKPIGDLARIVVMHQLNDITQQYV
ncbi:MAG: TetR/AcrR family transcriptional regulator [Paracoccus sp. (in: a-proteobacteria)]